MSALVLTNAKVVINSKDVSAHCRSVKLDFKADDITRATT